jgi:hypothetical protein
LEETEKYTHSDACNKIYDIFKKNTLIDDDIAGTFDRYTGHPG